LVFRCLLLVLVLVPLIAAAGPGTVGEKAPAFQATTLDGENVSLESAVAAKKWLFLTFWATWCPYCQAALPELKKVYESYKSKDMIFLAVNPGVNDSLEKIQLYVKKHDIPYPVVFDKGAIITRSFGVFGAPFVIIVDPAGMIRYRGSDVPGDLDERLKEWLK
jgi:peroxiredoxin